MVTVVNYKLMEKSIQNSAENKLGLVPTYWGEMQTHRDIPRANDIFAWVMRVLPRHIMRTGESCLIIDLDLRGYKDFREKQAALVNHVHRRLKTNGGWGQSAMQMTWDMVRAEHVTRALENNETLYWHAPIGYGVIRHNLQDVLDYIIATPSDIEKHIKRSWPEAAAASKKWHDAMKAKKETIKFTDECPVYLDLGDMKWVYLATRDEKARESDAMGHCVGRGGYDHAHIFSLRTKAGKPQVTVEWNNGVRQARGKFNNAVPENCKEALTKLEEELGKDSTYTKKIHSVSTPVGLGYIRPLEWFYQNDIRPE